MKHKFEKLFISLFTVLFLVSCAKPQIVSAQENVEDYGADQDYFLGLKLLAEEKENEARIKFNNCISNGTFYCAKRSAQALVKMGTVQERNLACQQLVKKFNDTESLLIAAHQFMSAEEYLKVIKLTDKNQLSEDDNELIRLRMESLFKKSDSRFTNELLEWFTSRGISQEHYKFYRDVITGGQTPLLPQHLSMISFRIDVYKRDYHKAFEATEELIKCFEKADLEPYGLLVSDMGKAYLYGNDNYYENALAFQDLAYLYKDSPAEFYFWFYAGRFYVRAENYKSQAINCFKNAITSTDNPKQKDNALWYMLDSKVVESYENLLDELGTYASQWSDPEYFDDFFESLIMSLVVSGDWDSFPLLYEQIGEYASDETTAKIAYICGRLIQEKYIKVKNHDKQIAKYFTRACKSGTSPYYKILAAYQLGLSESEIEKLLCKQIKTPDENFVQNYEAERLLKGYVKYGFPEKVYDEWQELYKDGVSTDVSMYLADFLYKCGKENYKYLNLSLRIAARSANISNRPLTIEELRLVYPKNYSEYVEDYSNQYELDSSVMYALIRSESFFDPDVESVAGAVGLTQLMQLTSEDIARKLKVTDYSLTDPEVNIKFGTYYLSELYKRCDNAILQAFFSYNAGITRVRRWLNSSMIEFGIKRNMPGDLFLETVPFAETREYGRKLISASVMYKWLYQEKNNSSENIKYSKIVDALLY